MTVSELASLLRSAYNHAPERRKASSFHLFGIKYHKELHSVSLKELVREAGVGDSYVTEINKGINLAEYVNLKTDLWFG